MQDGYIELNMKMQKILRPEVKKREALGEQLTIGIDLKGFGAGHDILVKRWWMCCKR